MIRLVIVIIIFIVVTRWKKWVFICYRCFEQCKVSLCWAPFPAPRFGLCDNNKWWELAIIKIHRYVSIVLTFSTNELKKKKKESTKKYWEKISIINSILFDLYSSTWQTINDKFTSTKYKWKLSIFNLNWHDRYSIDLNW